MYSFLSLFTIWLVCCNVCHVTGSVEELHSDDYDYNDVVGIRCCPADDCYPTQQQIGAFNNDLTGRVILPHMAEYINQSHMYNTIEQRYPGIIVMVHSKEDIQKAILFSRKYNLHVTIRSSGHDFVGRSTCDSCLNINLSDMKQYEVKLSSSRSEHGEFKVQTGMTWGEIYKLLDGEQRVIVGGSGQTVTPGGYTLGGGHSPISKTYGYAVDNLLEVQAVLADGRIATCTANTTVFEELDGSVHSVSDGELFWAMSGGGGGTFGVVVYYVFELHPPSQMVRVGAWIPLKIDTLGMDISTEVLTILNNLINSLPKEWGGYYLLSNAKTHYQGIDMTGSLQIAMNKFAPWDGTEEDTFKLLIESAKKIQINVTFTNCTSFWDYQKSSYDPPITRVYTVGTMLQPDKLNTDLVELYRNEFFVNFKDMFIGCTGVLLGGKTREFANDLTPLHPGYRTAVSCISCGVVLGSPAQPWFEQSKYDDVVIPLADQMSERLQKFGSGMFNNEPTKNNPRWREDFWDMDNYNKLLKIKLRYDPENFLTCQHCVGSELKGRRTGKWTSAGVNNAANLPIVLLLLFVKFY